jgi:hypothetical protein
MYSVSAGVPLLAPAERRQTAMSADWETAARPDAARAASPARSAYSCRCPNCISLSTELLRPVGKRCPLHFAEDRAVAPRRSWPRAAFRRAPSLCAGATPATGVTFETLAINEESLINVRESLINEDGGLDQNNCTRFVANLLRVPEESTSFPGPPGTVWERRVVFRFTPPVKFVAGSDGGDGGSKGEGSKGSGEGGKGGKGKGSKGSGKGGGEGDKCSCKGK